MVEYVAPKLNQSAFHCPFCKAYAHQIWKGVYHQVPGYEQTMVDVLNTSTCSRCEKVAVWYKDYMLYPANSVAPLPLEDMPEDVKSDFNEARIVVSASPRSAAALLRLGLQKLMPHLGEKGKNLDDDIASLVSKGLSPKIQKALDTVRVIGNNAVHPGLIDMKDNLDTAIRLFELTNIIVEVTIVQDKLIDDMYDKLPESSKEAIKKRDT